jgi:hypothetical protein
MGLVFSMRKKSGIRVPAHSMGFHREIWLPTMNLALACLFSFLLACPALARQANTADDVREGRKLAISNLWQLPPGSPPTRYSNSYRDVVGFDVPP